MAAVEAGAGAPAPMPSVEELQSQLEHVYLQLASLYGLPTAVQVLGQVMTRVPTAAPTTDSKNVTTPLTKTITITASATASTPTPTPTPAAPQEEADPHTNPNKPHHKGHITRVGDGRAHVGAMWRKAVVAAQKAADPWAGRGLHRLAMEHCIRHRYRADKRVWVTDDVLVKIEHKPFAAGAMRECYAMKKISTFSTKLYQDWHRAQNCVAKSYKKPVQAESYFMDVIVQMDAKNMGEAYNSTDPPKQVDIMQAAILEFPDRPGAPVMTIEQFMTGDYVKYNSNSGFVLGDDLLRYTPQAFSHFTWCHTKGHKICVDIQGVGDLYTDPQIHTLDGEWYGDGNLGLRGMALFFRTHQCNPLCARLHLKPFTRCAPDVKAQGYTSDSSTKSFSGSRTETRTMVLRRNSSLVKRIKSIQRRQNVVPQPLPQSELIMILDQAPHSEAPESLVHLEVARVYAEVVMLPELRPEESPEDALKGGLFHLHEAVRLGCVLATTLLARMHTSMEPSSTAFAHLYKVAHQQGELVAYPAVAWQAAVLAAERGVGSAALAVAHGYATAQGLADGMLEEPQPQEAVKWYRRALEIATELGTLLAAQDQEQEMGVFTPATLRGPSDFPQRMGIRDNIILEGTEEESTTSSLPGTPRSGADGLSRTQSVFSATTDNSDASLETVGIITAKMSQPRKIPSPGFMLRLRLAAEEEASGLPHAAIHDYEVHAALGRLLLAQAEAQEGQGAEEAAQHLNQAAELASTAGKGRLAQQYFELAAQAESY